MDSSVIDVLDSLLYKKNYEEALTLKQTHAQELYEKGLDLIPVVCKHLENYDTPNGLDRQNCCEEILYDLSMNGNAKEILIGLLEQADSELDDNKYKTLLNPIQIVLKRLPTKRDKSLEWVMNILYTHISSLPLPKVYNFEEKERKLLDLEPETERINDVVSSLITFYRPFVDEISLRAVDLNIPKKIIDYRRHKMTFFCLQLLDHPLVYMDLAHKTGDEKNASRILAENIVANVKDLQHNFLKLFTFNSQIEHNSNEEDEKLTDLSLANFFYLIFAEGVQNSHIPCVYTHKHLVELCLPFVNTLLKRTEEHITHKGILLSSFIMKKIEDKKLGLGMLDFTEYISFAQNLIRVMLYSNVQEFRLEAVSLLREYINKYDLPGRYQLIKCLLNSNDHAGVQGLLIQSFKNNLNEEIAMKHASTYFIGSNLRDIIRVITRLAEGLETDVLEQSDRLLAALNFIRFLALRDKPKENVTGFWNLVNWLENDFFKPLRQCLDFSRAHYQLELKSRESEGKITELNKKIIPISKQHSEQVLKLALNTFDVIESITGRIEELINVGKPQVLLK